MTIWISITHRIIPAVRKHVVPDKPLAGAGVAVGVEESAEDGVVISALEVIEARLFRSVLPLRAIFAGFVDR